METKKKVIRDVTYTLNFEANTFSIGDETFDMNDNTNEEKFLFVMALFSSKDFVDFYESALKLRLNESNVGIETLKEKYAAAYKSLKQSVSISCSAYITAELMVRNRAAKIYLRDFIMGEEFAKLKSDLTAKVKEVLKNREFERVPIIVANHEIHEALNKEDVSLGNYEVTCGSYTNDGAIITNIKWCKANCEKFANCPVYAKMKKDDVFNYNLNMEYLAG